MERVDFDTEWTRIVADLADRPHEENARKMHDLALPVPRLRIWKVRECVCCDAGEFLWRVHDTSGRLVLAARTFPELQSYFDKRMAEARDRGRQAFRRLIEPEA